MAISRPDGDCRDTFFRLAKTCAKHGITFWEHLGGRLSVPGHPNPGAIGPNSLRLI
jgi:hypothetical protein